MWRWVCTPWITTTEQDQEQQGEQDTRPPEIRYTFVFLSHTFAPPVRLPFIKGISRLARL